jgi:acetyltransferase-like isoleucine patch superfamily enzyme
VVILTILQFLKECFKHFIVFSPSSRFFSNLRFSFYARKMKPGSGPFQSMTGLQINTPELVYIGKNVSINCFVIIDASEGGEISIGNDCMIGPSVLIRAADHRFDKLSELIRCQGHNPGKIIIEDNCWIAGHVTITRNVTIGSGSVIGANSVVTKDIPRNSIAAGNPAKVIRSREGF